MDIDPGNLTALMGLFQGAYKFERLDIAEHYLQKYLELYPGNIKILYCLAGTYFKQNKISDSRKVLEKIFIFDPDNPDANELLNKIESI
jgi:tetratricopeptide (TPR) repeat protein